MGYINILSETEVKELYPTSEILHIWKQFDHFPMETLTKAWIHRNGVVDSPRSLSFMKEQYEQYGNTGNCFDLAWWLINVFREEGLTAYAIGHDMGSPDAHVAVVVQNEHGYRYLCDLGDQWILPVLIDRTSEDYSEEALAGFFPGARVRIHVDQHQACVHYLRPNGKESRQTYELKPVGDKEFLAAAAYCQRLLNPEPLVERRIWLDTEVAHWEFYKRSSRLSKTSGLVPEPQLEKIEEWARRIHERTGMAEAFVREALMVYQGLSE